MSSQERKLANFYNFKDESTCKLCSLVHEFGSIGGNDLVSRKLGIFLDNGFEHDFLTCFIHYYWINEAYSQDKTRHFDEIVTEAYHSYQQMIAMVQVK